MKEMQNHSGATGEHRLDALFAQYRAACPDQDASSNFMPQLWQKIDAGRKVPAFLFRRWAKVCAFATAASALFISTLLIPSYQRGPVYETHYVDVLFNADSKEDAVVLSEVTLPRVILQEAIAPHTGDWE